MQSLPAPGQILDAWWPCDRCSGSNPGLDVHGAEIPGPPVKLVNNSYLCGPCRGSGHTRMPQDLARERAIDAKISIPLTPNEQLQIERAKAGDFSGFRVRDEHGNFSTV